LPILRIKSTKIASVIGRNFAMDRDEKWNYIETTYNLLTKGKGAQFETASTYIEENYKEGITDEFVKPACAKTPADEPGNNRIKNNDSLIFFNYREDSARELSRAFAEENFDKFPRQKINNLFFATMTEYDTKIKANVAFPPLSVEHPLAQVISAAGLKQLHVAESEKYAHVTYFFNGGKEEPYPGEDRLLIPSPTTTAYDETPAMSAFEITDNVIQKLDSYDFILINYANADMVGHTGNLEACVKAIEILDECVGKLSEKILEKNGVAIITSDHGNVEEKMYAFTGERKTNHTLNPVPFYLLGERFKRKKPLTPPETARIYEKINGTLTDIAPTILDLLQLEIPPEMTGQSLLSMLE